MKNKQSVVAAVVTVLMAVAPLSALAALNGKALFESKCVQCHDLSELKEVLKMKPKDKNRWKKTVAAMKQAGMKVTDAEEAAIVKYLIDTAGKK